MLSGVVVTLLISAPCVLGRIAIKSPSSNIKPLYLTMKSEMMLCLSNLVQSFLSAVGTQKAMLYTVVILFVCNRNVYSHFRPTLVLTHRRGGIRFLWRCKCRNRERTLLLKPRGNTTPYRGKRRHRTQYLRSHL